MHATASKADKQPARDDAGRPGSVRGGRGGGAGLTSAVRRAKEEMIVEEERGQRALQQSGRGSLSQVEETGSGGGQQTESSTSSHLQLLFMSGLKHSGKSNTARLQVIQRRTNVSSYIFTVMKVTRNL